MATVTEAAYAKYENVKATNAMAVAAGRFLTPFAFKKLHTEIQEAISYGCLAHESDEKSFIVRHMTKMEGGRTVRFDALLGKVACSCKKFEYMGILCRHAVRVLVQRNVFEIPSQYLLARWCKLGVLPEKSVICTKRQKAERWEVLRAAIGRITEAGVLSEQRFAYVKSALSEVEEAINAMVIIDNRVCSNDGEVGLSDKPDRDESAVSRMNPLPKSGPDLC